MKSVKFAFAALVLAGGIVAAFAFTAPKKKAIDTWYLYNGSLTNLSSVTNPSNYSFFGEEAPEDQNPNVNLHAIKVDAGTEVYTTGTYINKPIVDVAGALRTAILDATGLDLSPKNEIPDRVVLKP